MKSGSMVLPLLSSSCLNELHTYSVAMKHTQPTLNLEMRQWSHMEGGPCHRDSSTAEMALKRKGKGSPQGGFAASSRFGPRTAGGGGQSAFLSNGLRGTLEAVQMDAGSRQRAIRTTVALQRPFLNAASSPVDLFLWHRPTSSHANPCALLLHGLPAWGTSDTTFF